MIKAGIKKLLNKYKFCLFSRMLLGNRFSVSKGNIINAEDTYFRNCEISIVGCNNIIEIADGGIIFKTVLRIRGDNNIIRIGNNVKISNGGFYIEDDNNIIDIGDGTTTSGQVNFSCTEGTSIVVGSDCMFSANIEVRTSDAHSIVDLEGKRINESQDVIIGSHCWLGNTVFILKGSRIGDNCVVGAGSIVTHGVSSSNIIGAIIAGNPAKVIRNNTNWIRERLKNSGD